YTIENGRMIGCDCVQVLAAWQPLVTPQRVVPAATDNPFACTGSFRAVRNALLHLLQRFGAGQINIELLKPTRGQVSVGVIEAGHDKVPAQIDDLSFLVSESQYLFAKANRDDLAVRNRNSPEPF